MSHADVRPALAETRRPQKSDTGIHPTVPMNLIALMPARARITFPLFINNLLLFSAFRHAMDHQSRRANPARA
jgi:hypothetical protein